MRLPCVSLQQPVSGSWQPAARWPCLGLVLPSLSVPRLQQIAPAQKSSAIRRRLQKNAVSRRIHAENIRRCCTFQDVCVVDVPHKALAEAINVLDSPGSEEA